MVVKIFASCIIIAVTYVFGVFFAPVITDKVAEQLWILTVNTTLRAWKGWIDSTSETLLQLQWASWAINGVRGIVIDANEKINQTTEAVNGIRQTAEDKFQQAQKTAESIRKASEAIGEVQSNVSALTSFSGSATVSASGSMSGSVR